MVRGLLEKGHRVLGVDLRGNPNLNDNDNRLEQVVLDSAKVIAEEKAVGRAKHVLRIPRWMVVCQVFMYILSPLTNGQMSKVKSQRYMIVTIGCVPSPLMRM